MTITASEKLHDCLRSLSSANVSGSDKGIITRSLIKMLESSESTDDESSSPLLHSHNVLNAYLYLPAIVPSDDMDESKRNYGSGIRLPALHDFNRLFKRGYAILVWIRPLVTPKLYSTVAVTTQHQQPPQTLFRMATFDNRTFLQCTLSHWTFHDGIASAKIILSIGGTAIAAVQPPGSTTTDKNSQHQQQHKKQLLPIHLASATLSFSTVTTDWQLLTISHSNPYLKRPRFAITLSGSIILDAECPYPVVNSVATAIPNYQQKDYNNNMSNKSSIDMDELLLLHNLHIPLFCGSCAVLHEPFLSEEPIALLAELGPCTSGSIIAHPPPVPFNRDAALVSVVSSSSPRQHANYSLGMADSILRFEVSSNNNTRTTTTGTIEYSRIGIPSCKEGNRGTEIVQLLRSKIIYEFHPWDAPHFRHTSSSSLLLSPFQPPQQLIIIPPTFICAKLGLTENVRLGLVEPNPGSFHVLTTSTPTKHNNNSNIILNRNNNATLSGLVVLGTGCVIRNADLLMQQEQQQQQQQFSFAVSNIVQTHIAVHSLSLLILPFRLALPALGEDYYDDVSHKKKYQQGLLQTLTENDGFVIGEICHLVAALLRSNGEIREEAVQSGFIYTLSSLLRRVIRRGYRCGLLTTTNCEVNTSETTTTITTVEDSSSSSCSSALPAIYPLPAPVISGALNVVSACCGGIYKYYNKQLHHRSSSSTVVHHPAVTKESNVIPPALFLRRTSDLALQCLHGFCLQGVLWGASTSSKNNNWKAAAAMLKAITSRYCPSKILGNTENPFGDFLRNHMTVQALLDMIQWYYVLPTTDGVSKSEIISCGGSLTTLLFHLLYASLSADSTTEAGTRRSEHDIQACAAALSSTSLNCFVSDILLKALHGILAKCTVNTPVLHWYAYPDFTAELNLEETMFVSSNSSSTDAAKSSQQRDIIANRLARDLNVAEGGSVVLPMLLSRMISCGAASVLSLRRENETAPSTPPEEEPKRFNNTTNLENQLVTFLDWKVQWRRTLLLWLWLLHFPHQQQRGNEQNLSSSPYNFMVLLENTLTRSCALLLACAKTGALDGCVSIEVIDRLLPLAGGTHDGDENTTDASIRGVGCVSMDRLKLILPLVPALVVSLLPSPNSNNNSNSANTSIPPSQDGPAITNNGEKFSAVLLYKLVYALQYSMHAALKLAFLQLGRRSPSTAAGGRSSSTTAAYGNLYGGWTNLSLTSPGKRLLIFSQRCVKALTETLFFMLPHIEKLSFDNTDLENDDAVSSQRGTSYDCHTSSSIHELLSLPPDVLLKEVYAMMQGLLASVLCFVMENINNGNSGVGGQPSITIWKSVIGAIPAAVDYKSEDQKDTRANDDTDRVLFLCDIISISIARFCVLPTSNYNAAQKKIGDSSSVTVETSLRQGSWPNEICISMARLAILIQEKSLLQPAGLPNRYNHSQLKLLRQILHVLKIGREQMGWCQLTVFSHALALPYSSSVSSSITTSAADAAISAKKPDSASNASSGFSVPKVRITSAPLHHSNDGVPHPDLVTLPNGFEETSKQYQPFLRPFLNFTMQALGYIPETRSKLWEYLMLELKATLTAALLSLTFPCARDVGIGALCATRSALKQLVEDGNVLGQRVCAKLILVIVEELRERHVNERRIRADIDDDSSRAFVEQMIFGSNPFLTIIDTSKKSEEITQSSRPRVVKTDSMLDAQADKVLVDSEDMANNGDNCKLGIAPSTIVSNMQKLADSHLLTDDFIMYTDALTPEATALSKLPEILQRSGTSQLSWTSYAGFFSSLEKCRIYAKSDDISFEVFSECEEASFGGRLQSNAIDTLTNLSSYLDVWDEHIRRESTFDIVELFEVCTLGSFEDHNQKLGDTSVSDSWEMQIGNDGYSPYANTVAQFIELATGERLRLSESRNAVLPYIVHSSDAATEHYIYRYRLDIARDGRNAIPELYDERATGDSGKDVYSRLVSYPVHRQFPRYVPSYLDHSRSTLSGEGMDDSLKVEGATNNSLSAAINDSNSMQARTTTVGSNYILEQDILNVAAHVKIVDITKSVAIEECEQGLDSITGIQENRIKSDGDESDGLDLGFVDRSSFMNRASSERDGDYEYDIPRIDQHHPDAKVSPASPPRNVKASQQRESVPFFDASMNQGVYVPPIVLSTTTAFALPPAASLGTGLPVECYFDNVLHVRAEGNRKATMIITGLHLMLEYESDIFEGEELAVRESESRNDVDTLNKHNADVVALRPKLLRWAIAEISQIFLRRYRLRDSALEIFLVPSGGSEGSVPSVSAFLDFGPGYVGNSRRDGAGTALMKRAPSQTIKQWPERSSYFVHEHRQRLTSAWVDGRLSNFDYLLHLNTLAGRTFNDLCQYPVMPWVLSNYVSKETPDLSDRKNFRDLSKPMGALNSSRLEDFMERFETFQDPTIPPFMYGSHYSTNAGVVLHFLVRLHPFAGLHRQLQNGHFDVADRLFSSVPRTWEGCTGSSAAEVKELTPEWYSCPTFLRNTNDFKLGSSQDGVVIDDVVLPPWAHNNPERFIEVMRAALESDICSEMLPDWIDLIFGYKQQGPEAVKANNVFFYLTYYGSVDVASIEDESLRTATELQIAHFGQCPMQLFWRPHPRKHIDRPNVGFAEFGFQEQSLTNNSESPSKNIPQRLYPFLYAPPSHVIQLDAPPPKSNASLIAVRLAGIDRILTVDSHGIFHCFRYSWKADPPLVKEEVMAFNEESTSLDQQALLENGFDRGCFIAQRELPHFRAVPRLPHISLDKTKRVAVALSKTLFASRTLLLALSDGDGKGGLAMQFIDPAKGLVKGETIVPSVHSERVTAIAMDPLGVATGGGAGGELAIVGSTDGSASLWRFISSHYLPLRPKQRMRGHNGSAIHAVAINSTLNICASVSSHRCCIFGLGNGVLLCNISPPTNPCPGVIDLFKNDVTTEFVETPAACFSILGYIVLVCKSTVKRKPLEKNVVDCPAAVDSRVVITLQLFSLEGVHSGSHALGRSVPHKIFATFDGRAVLVSFDGGVSVHLVSPTTPLELLSEWAIKEDDGKGVPVLDIDIGPSLFRPVVAAAACSEGALRLHALPGISAWSEANKKGSMSTVVGNAFAKPAEKLKQAGGIVKGIGSSIVGLGRELGREAMSDVKERGVAGFLGGVFAKGMGNR